MEKNEQLLHILLDRGLVTEAKIEELKKRGDDAKNNLASLIIQLGLVDEETITKIKAEIAGLPYYNIQNDELAEGILNFLSEDIARTYKIICFAREEKIVSIGLVEPDLKAMEAVNFLVSEDHLQPSFYLISVTVQKPLFH